MEQRRIKIDGYSDSDIHMKIAVLQMKTGAIHLSIEGVDPTIQNLVAIRQILDEVCKKIDTQLPIIVQESVNKMLK